MDAKKERQGADAALALARSVSRIHVARGKKVETFDVRATAPDDETLLKALLGPTGNLRAPTIRRGNTLYVGFNAEMYDDALA